MFVQLVLGQAADAAAFRRQWERWVSSLAVGAAGFDGATGGVTADHRAVLVTRFESEPAARAHDMQAVAGTLAAPFEVLETADVTLHGGQGWETARFVQLMRARVRDRRRFEAIEDEIAPQFMKFRPDALAAYRAWFPGGSVVAIDYFTSEEQARAGERKQMPELLAQRFGEWMSLLDDVEWFDLTEPWIATP